VPPRVLAVEFTAVLALIAVLAGVVTIGVRGQMIKGKQNAARGEIATVRNAVELFYQSAGRYPTNEEGLAALARASDQNPEPLLPRVPTDPWGHPYVYLNPRPHRPVRGHLARRPTAGRAAPAVTRTISSADLRSGPAAAGQVRRGGTGSARALGWHGQVPLPVGCSPAEATGKGYLPVPPEI
jgi:type II secretion system protein G